MLWNVKLGIYLLGFLLVTVCMVASCNAISFRSSETTDQILDKVAASISNYHKVHNKFPDVLTDIKNFPYDIKDGKDGTDGIPQRYDIRNLDGSYIDGRKYLRLRYGATSKRMQPEFVRSMNLDHDNLTCHYYLRENGSYKKNCRSTQPGGFRQ